MEARTFRLSPSSLQNMLTRRASRSRAISDQSAVPEYRCAAVRALGKIRGAQAEQLDPGLSGDQRLDEAANRGNVTIHVIDPRPLGFELGELGALLRFGAPIIAPGEDAILADDGVDRPRLNDDVDVLVQP